jgi:hypothetical protein
LKKKTAGTLFATRFSGCGCLKILCKGGQAAFLSIKKQPAPFFVDFYLAIWQNRRI